MAKLIDFIFYRSWRVGKHGRPFLLWKFRTMVEGADRKGSYSVAEDDSRITRIGRILRNSHLDELPNLINVIRGEMSIFGPRPEIGHYVDRMPPAIRRTVLSVRPGCIDKATLWNYNEGQRLKGKTDPEAYYEEVIWPEKLRLQCESILGVNL